MEKLSGQTMDLVQHNIDNLKQLFPEIVTEGKIDFEKLKLLLGENVEINNEKYAFTWNGKSDAIKLAQTPSLGTLRPDKESSKNWDETENLYIEGDNLEVLKLLQKSYFGKVKMIYIDPPYNTGKDFVYNDDFKNAIEYYKKITNQEHNANSELSGRFHTDWLNMMYPRLKLARNLLKDDGVIYISIDDNEKTNLEKIANEIFGEENKLGVIMWKKKTNGNNMGYIPPVHDYILAYSKNASEGCLLGMPLSEEYISKNYSNPDNDFRGPWTTSDLSANHKGPYFPIVNPATREEFYPPEGRYWVFNEEEVEKRISEGRIIFGKSGNARPVQKVFLNERKSLRRKADSWWDKHGMNEDGTKEVGQLVGTKIFSHPKPTELIKNLCAMTMDKDDIILDFFSGSATTAHAVMQLNVDDNGNRKYIMVQLPEKVKGVLKSEKGEFNNVCEIGQERIRCAGDMIVKESGKVDLDIGFRVFKLDSSNIKQWSNEEALEDLLLGMESNIVEGRVNEDLLYEILLKIGLPLNIPIENINIDDKIIYDVAFGSVLVCLEDDITLDVTSEMLNYVSEDIETKVIFKEIGFRDDTAKTNAIQTLKKHGIKEENIRSV
ncbi:site-specific DNA-methyltransferase [Bacillus mycoides]|uniref:site-specific DNA-methyltransferase n=1 Tax=Bacillus mycoides TaxID=1405 RepID=UPI000871E4AF|nr:site-specific DNA-methyltransferase [Bacillus mycoides]OFD40566.1 hypothetical protein BWGOE2_32930 [Bacillus mycoides]OFD49623.1 hypothetical protein BWGOE1_09070 [Bacillus mycoides]